MSYFSYRGQISIAKQYHIVLAPLFCSRNNSWLPACLSDTMVPSLAFFTMLTAMLIAVPSAAYKLHGATLPKYCELVSASSGLCAAAPTWPSIPDPVHHLLGIVIYPSSSKLCKLPIQYLTDSERGYEEFGKYLRWLLEQEKNILEKEGCGDGGNLLAALFKHTVSEDGGKGVMTDNEINRNFGRIKIVFRYNPLFFLKWR